MTYEVTLADRTFVIGVERDAQGFLVTVDDGPQQRVDVGRPEKGVLSVIHGDYCYEAGVVEQHGAWEIDIYGSLHPCEVVDARRKALRLGGGVNVGLVSTSMPGRIVRILVELGQQVEQGEPLLIVEAMKMENETKAAIGGRIVELLVSEGQTVEAGAKLVRIEPE